MNTMAARERLVEGGRHPELVGEADAREVRGVLARLAHGCRELRERAHSDAGCVGADDASPRPSPTIRHRSLLPGRSCPRDYGGPERSAPPVHWRGAEGDRDGSAGRAGAGGRPSGPEVVLDPGEGLPPGQAAARARHGRARSGSGSCEPWRPTWCRRAPRCPSPSSATTRAWPGGRQTSAPP